MLNPNHYYQGSTLDNLCGQLNIAYKLTVQEGLETKWEGSVTILSLVAKLSKKVIPPKNFADRLSCETVVLKNKKKSTFIRYQSVVKTKFNLLSFYYYKNIILFAFYVKKNCSLSEKNIRLCNSISIGTSVICSDIWHKRHAGYFKIVIRNFTSR